MTIAYLDHNLGPTIGHADQEFPMTQRDIVSLRKAEIDWRDMSR